MSDHPRLNLDSLFFIFLFYFNLQKFEGSPDYFCPTKCLFFYWCCCFSCVILDTLNLQASEYPPNERVRGKKKKSLFGWTVYVRPQQWWLVTQKIGEDRRKTNMESYNCFQKQKSLSGEKAASLKTFSINILFLNKEVLILSLEWFWMCHFIYKVKFRFIVLFYCDNRFMFSSNRQHITWFTPVSCVFS